MGACAYGVSAERRRRPMCLSRQNHLSHRHAGPSRIESRESSVRQSFTIVQIISSNICPESAKLGPNSVKIGPELTGHGPTSVKCYKH